MPPLSNQTNYKVTKEMRKFFPGKTQTTQTISAALEIRDDTRFYEIWRFSFQPILFAAGFKADF